RSSKVTKKKASNMSLSKFVVPDDEDSEMEDENHSEDEDEDDDLSISEEVRVSRGDPAALFNSDEEEEDDDLPIVRKRVSIKFILIHMLLTLSSEATIPRQTVEPEGAKRLRLKITQRRHLRLLLRQLQ